MPMFYLHIRSVGGLVEDLEGKDYPSLAAAKADAREAIRAIVAEHLANGAEVRIRSIEIHDEMATPCAKVSLAEAIPGLLPKDAL